MKIAVYDQPFTGALGGAETCVAVLAEALSAEHDIDLVHHVSGFAKEDFARFAGVNLDKVSLRYVERELDPYSHRHNPVLRYTAVPKWHATLSQGYDVFLPFTHEIPPFCYARHGILSVLFPAMAMAARPDKAKGKQVWRVNPVALFVRDEWRRRISTYDTCCAISQYSKDWTARRWDLNCEIVYPPVRLQQRALTESKKPQILAVGRFTANERSKRQKELVEVAVRLLANNEAANWTFVCAGAVGTDEGEKNYYNAVAAQARYMPQVEVKANLPRVEVENLYSQSAIYWHASGLGDYGNERPDLAEHFGITTAEAMSAGCVPIVIRRGGQPEMVEHGVSGFVWDTIEELIEYTLLLMKDNALRLRMSQAAKKASERFHADHFVRYYKEKIAQFGGVPAQSDLLNSV